MVAFAAGVTQLSAELAHACIMAGLTQKTVAKQMNWTPARVARIERSQSDVSKPGLLALLALYDVPDPIRITSLGQHCFAPHDYEPRQALKALRWAHDDATPEGGPL